MSASDDDEARRRARKKKKRVTLNWARNELLLPGEMPASGSGDESGELSLPAHIGPLLARAPEVGAAGEHPEGNDGWERQRPLMTPPPPPPTGLDDGGTADDGGALSLVDRRGRPSSASFDLATEMNDRFALGDYTAALRAADLMLGRDPEHEAALRISGVCREKLAALYMSRLGSMSRVPEVAVDVTDVRWLGLDHRAGFLLSQIDGANTLEELLDVSGMPRLEALKVLVELLDMGAIRFGD